MTPLRLALAAAALVALTSPALAQEPWTIELRTGGNAATESFDGADLEFGAGLEVSIAYRVAPGVSLFGGWDRQHHRAEDQIVGMEVELEDTGYVYGVRFEAPAGARVKPFVRVAGLWNHVEVESEDGEALAESDHTWGFEAGAGLDVSVGRTWSLTPGVRYRRFEPTVRFGSTELPATLAYVVFDVGIAWRF